MILAGLAGIVFSATLGWLKSDEPFIAKKFVISIMTGVTTLIGLLVAEITLAAPITILTYVYMFAGTAGVEVMVNRAIGTVS